MTIAQRATRSVLWMFAESWIGLVWGLISFAILAHTLGPEVYGTLAIAHLALGFAGIFLGGALTEALRQFDKLTPGHANAAFWLNMVLGVIFTLIVVLAAPHLATIFELPELAQIIPLIALTSLFGQFADVPEALLERELQHKKLIILENVIGFPCSVLCIGLAISGFGIWSLVWAGVVSTGLTTVAVCCTSNWRPTLRLTRSELADIVAFGRDTVFLRILGVFDDVLPKFAVAYVLGERALGLYTIAMNLSGQLAGLIMGPLSDVAMVVVARLQRDMATLNGLLREIFSVTTFVMYPAILGACFVAPIATELILGAQWRGVETPLIIALLIGLRHATGDFNIAILRGLGDTKTPLLSLGLGVGVFAVALPIGVQFGLAGIMAVVTLRVFATWPLSAWFVERRCGFPMLDQFTLGWRALLCAGVMSICLWSVIQLDAFAMLPDVAKLAVLPLIGVAIYSLLFAMIWRDHLFDGLRRFRSAFQYDAAPESWRPETPKPVTA